MKDQDLLKAGPASRRTDGRSERTRKREGVTPKSVGVGLALVVFINVLITYAEYIVQSSKMNMSHFSVALFMTFFVLAAFVNPALKRLRPRLALSRAELMIVLGMGLVGAMIPTAGLTGFFLGMIATPYYFATPENQWPTYLHDHIPSWLAPHDGGDAIRWLFEGMPAGSHIPWGIWSVPLFWWFCFLGAVTLVSMCVVAILHRQWSEHERLDYPMLGPPLEILDLVGEGGKHLLPFIRNRIFWIGFMFSFGLIAWKTLSFFSPLVPEIPDEWGRISFGRYAPSIPVRVNFLTLGIAYFASLDMLTSFWVFLLSFSAEVAIFHRFNFDIGPNGDAWSSNHAAYSWQGLGALAFLVGAGLWAGREHLRKVFRKAFFRASEVDDAEELLSYWTAVWGLILGLVFIVWWLNRAGMEMKVALSFTFATLILYVGLARILSQMGVIYLRGPMTAQSFSEALWGTASMSGGSLTSLAFSYSTISHGRGLFMPALVHAAKLTDLAGGNRRRMLWALVVTFVVGTAVSTWFTLYMGYTHGAYNFTQLGPFASGPRKFLNYAVTKIRNPEPTNWSKIAFFWIGVAAMWGLTLARHRIAWWPVVPIAFPTAGTLPTRSSAFSVVLAWVCKAAVLRFGGILLYRQSRPFFVGLASGYALGVGAACLADIVWFNGNGHYLHGW